MNEHVRLSFKEKFSGIRSSLFTYMALGLLGLGLTISPVSSQELFLEITELPVCNTELTRLYVDDVPQGENPDGGSWDNAYTKLQDALLYIKNNSTPDEAGTTPSWDVWVAEGNYSPTEIGDRNARFNIGHCTEVYGGFTGTETDLSQRNFREHQTILSGETGDPTKIEDNSDIIVSFEPFTTPESKIDGFIVQAGYSNQFLHGAVFITLGGPVIQNTIFRNNTSLDGGVVNLNGALPFIANSLFRDNSAQAVVEGSNGTPSTIPGYTFAFVNSVITGNRGRCFSLFDGFNPSFIVNSFCINGTSEFEMVRNTFDFFLINSGIWGNTAAEIIDSDRGYEAVAMHSLIQGGYEGPGNIAVDPGFTDRDGHVLFYSPLVDAGTDAILARDVGDIDGDGDPSEIFPVDAEGNPRIQGTIDIGPYEQRNYKEFFPRVVAQVGDTTLYMPLVQNQH